MPRDVSTLIDLDALNAKFDGDPVGAIHHAIRGPLGPTALVSSFGAESAVLLHMAAQIDRTVPVIFLDTQFLFQETRDYQSALAEWLGLTDIRRIEPDKVDLLDRDPTGTLHQRDPDGCCALRKARPLEQALGAFNSWISGRKRFQGGQRANLTMFEQDPVLGITKINPLAGLTATELQAYATAHALPQHPLVAKGFASIGCAPCTTPVRPGEDIRAGRWRDTHKTECGIHLMDRHSGRRTA